MSVCYYFYVIDVFQQQGLMDFTLKLYFKFGGGNGKKRCQERDLQKVSGVSFISGFLREVQSTENSSK